MDDSAADADVHDVFRMLYAGDEWDSDEDDTLQESNENKIIAAFDAILAPTVPAKRRLFNPPVKQPTLFPSTSPLPSLPDVSTYAPFSPLPLLSRLRTFVLGSSSLPPQINAQQLALHGWVSTRRDSLSCATCKVAWGTGGLDTLPERVRSGVVVRLASSLSTRHGPGCGWRARSSPPSLLVDLRRRLHPWSSTSLAPLARSIQSRSLSGPLTLRWACPLSTDELAVLVSALSRHDKATIHVDALPAAIAFFGWYPYDPSFPSDHVSSSHSTPTDIVRCRICTRRVGLWVFADTTDRTFDLANEHISWCPLRDDAWHGATILSSASLDSSLAAVLERPHKRFRRRQFNP